MTDHLAREATSLLRVTAERPAEPGRRYAPQTDPQPLQTDDRRTVLVGTLAWAVAGLALLPFAGTLIDSGRLWWFLACAAGVGLGLVGLEVVRHQNRRHRSVRPTDPEGIG